MSSSVYRYSLRADQEVVFAAVMQDRLALSAVSAELKSDREIVFAAVKLNGQALWFTADELKTDPEVRAITPVKRKYVYLVGYYFEMKKDKKLS